MKYTNYSLKFETLLDLTSDESFLDLDKKIENIYNSIEGMNLDCSISKSNSQYFIDFCIEGDDKSSLPILEKFIEKLKKELKDEIIILDYK